MSWIDGYQVWLSENQSLQNAQLVVNHFAGTDWSKESLSAMCGNMRHESSINPNMYEYGYVWEDDRGFGLVQWTPRSKYWNWAVSQGLDPYSGNSQLSRIDYEVENNIQWIADGHRRRYGLESKYDISFEQFRTNSEGYTVQQLTEAFMWNYEGPNYTAGSNSLLDRQAFGIRCFGELEWDDAGGGEPTTPPPSDNQNKNKKIISLLLSDTLNGWRW